MIYIRLSRLACDSGSFREENIERQTTEKSARNQRENSLHYLN